MELHYFTLKRQAAGLTARLAGGRVRSCFTQQKNEQIIRIETAAGGLRDLVISVNPRYPFLLVQESGERAKNSTDVLEEITNLQIKKFDLLPGDRVVVVTFHDSSRQLLIQLFRNNANVFLVDDTLLIENAFKNRKKHLRSVYRLSQHNRTDILTIDQQQFLQMKKSAVDQPVGFFLRRTFQLVTPLVVQEVLFRCGLKPEAVLSSLDETRLSRIFREIRAFLTACQTDPPRVYLENDLPEIFSLTELRSAAHLTGREFETVNEALRFFLLKRIAGEKRQRKLQKIRTALEGKSKQISQLILQLENLPPEQERRNYYQKIGELLLTQLQQVPTGKSEVLLTDYFDPEQRQVKVRLNPKLTVPENAEHYFQKAKQSAARRAQLRAQLLHLKTQKKQMERIEEKLQQPVSYKELNRIEKQLLNLHVLQPAEEKLKEVYRPYKQYFFGNYEIWVGKNARANDRMTFTLAHKEDWWLHAQGVSGSHVVVRNPARQPSPPPEVLEYAARLAATNSTAKHSSYVPVLFSRVKYLRKPRGSAPGAVLPERSKTIFAEPLR